MEEKDLNNPLEEKVPEAAPESAPVVVEKAAETPVERAAETEKPVAAKESEPSVGGAEALAPVAPAGAKAPAAFSGEEEDRLNKAVALAFSEGIERAVESIKKDDNAYLVDALHDKLVDELYKRLIQAGKLKEM